MSTTANEVTGANAGGPCPLLIRVRWAARIAQFRRSALLSVSCEQNLYDHI